MKKLVILLLAMTGTLSYAQTLSAPQKLVATEGIYPLDGKQLNGLKLY